MVHLHCSRTAEGVIFGGELRELAASHDGFRLQEWLTRPAWPHPARAAQDVCADWRERETFLCGPAGLLAAMGERWRSEGLQQRLHVEHFQPDASVGEGKRGGGGAIRFCSSDIEAHSDGEQPILAAGEAAGATLSHGCRMGICHSCVGRLRSGRVRDLRTGRVHGQPGEMLRTCVNAPEGAVEIDL